jgi:hypothetical protein
VKKRWAQIELGSTIQFFDHKRVPLNSRERALRPGPYPYYGASGVVDYIDDYIFDGRYLLIAEDGENLNSCLLRSSPTANSGLIITLTLSGVLRELRTTST